MKKFVCSVCGYVHTGDKIYVDGKIQYRQYDDKKGVQRTTTEVIVDNLELLTPKPTQQQS